MEGSTRSRHKASADCLRKPIFKKPYPNHSPPALRPRTPPYPFLTDGQTKTLRKTKTLNVAQNNNVSQKQKMIPNIHIVNDGYNAPPHPIVLILEQIRIVQFFSSFLNAFRATPCEVRDTPSGKAPFAAAEFGLREGSPILEGG